MRLMVVSALAMMASCGQACAGWQGIAWGASLSEVQSAVSQTVQVDSNTLQMPFSVPDASLTGAVPITAKLLFPSGLQRVELTPDDTNSCRFLLESTLGVYGAPVTSGDEYGYLHQWRDTPNGNLVYLFINESQDSCSVTYEPLPTPNQVGGL